MTGAREGDGALAGIDYDEQQRGDHPRASGRVDDAVELAQGLLRAVALYGKGAQRVTELAHRDRGADAMADDVPDHHRGAVVVELHRVIPVTTDLRGEPGRQVARGQLHARMQRQPLGQETPLQRLHEQATVGVALRVVDRQRHPLGGERQQLEVALVEVVLVTRAEQ